MESEVANLTEAADRQPVSHSFSRTGRHIPLLLRSVIVRFSSGACGVALPARNSFTRCLHSFATALRMKPIQALVWFTCWSAWTLASLQFYLLPFTLSNIAKFLDVKQSKISEINTTTMLSRSIGAVIFGV